MIYSGILAITAPANDTGKSTFESESDLTISCNVIDFSVVRYNEGAK